MKKSKSTAATEHMGINLGGHQLVLGGGAGGHVSNNSFNRQYQLIPPRHPSYNANTTVPPFSNVNTNIRNPVPLHPVMMAAPPSVSLPYNIPAPPSIPLPPNIHLPHNLPPPPTLPLPAGPMPSHPPQPTFTNYNVMPQQQAPSTNLFVPHSHPQSQSSYNNMLPPPTFHNKSTSSIPSTNDRFASQHNVVRNTSTFKRSNSLDSLRDFPSSPRKRVKKSPSRYNLSKSSVSKRSFRRSSRNAAHTSSFDEKSIQDKSFEFIRLKPKCESNVKPLCETLSVTFQPDHVSTPKTMNQPDHISTPKTFNKDDDEDESPIESVATPEWKLPESESDSGLDSDNDSEHETKDFPFKIVKGRELYPQSRVPFIDTHCHLDYMYVKESHYTSFRAYIHKKDFPANFSGCITCFCDPPAMNDTSYYEEVLSEDGVWGTFGLHPHNAAWFTDDLLEVMKLANSHSKSVAWGEIGLDYTSKTTDEMKHIQQRAFVAQLKVAVEMRKPIVIHGRCAHEDTFSLLKQYVPVDHKIHFHCFSATLSFAEKLIDYFHNLFIGITGLITYNNTELETIVQEFPFERILVETDSPYMRPSYRKKILDKSTPRVTTPGMGLIIAQKIADIKGLEIDDVLIQIRENCTEMYGI